MKSENIFLFLIKHSDHSRVSISNRSTSTTILKSKKINKYKNLDILISIIRTDVISHLSFCLELYQ